MTQVEQWAPAGATPRARSVDSAASEPLSAAADRVQRLREQLLNTVPEVCAERARYITETYRQHEADPPVLRRARALANVLDHMTIYLADGELPLRPSLTEGDQAAQAILFKRRDPHKSPPNLLIRSIRSLQYETYTVL